MLIPLLARALAAQQPMPARAPAPFVVGDIADERARIAALFGDSTAGARPVRTTSDWIATRPVTTQLVMPAIRVVYNSGLASGANDGALWAGRGLSVLARAGGVVRFGALHVVLLPEVTHAQNRPYEVVPGRDSARSRYASPWHVGRYSADLPLRFGDAPLTTIGPGQSSVSLRFRSIAFGVSTDDEWWGPGVQNAIVLSNNAEGVPRAFVATPRPLRTPIGDVEARWVAGVLTESIFFDARSDDDFRSFSGIVASLRPRGARQLTVGVERTVVAAIDRRGDVTAHALDALVSWPTSRDTSGLAATRLPLLGGFARWAATSAGFEAYVEWTRRDLPKSFRELLIAPQYSQAYTLGVGQAIPTGPQRGLVARFELTNLEQSRVLSDRPLPVDYYTSSSPSQGYTQRGQVLGAAIGPGASSQWLSVAYATNAWTTELFARRVRHENDAMYRERLANPLRHDVSVSGGVRATRGFGPIAARVELSVADRINYLFQNGTANIGGVRTVDVHNVQLAVDLSPRAALRPLTSR